MTENEALREENKQLLGRLEDIQKWRMGLGRDFPEVSIAALASPAPTSEPSTDPELEIWLCPIHRQLDDIRQLRPLDNCVACIRVERDELKAEIAAAPKPQRSLLRPVNEPLPSGCYCQPGKCMAPVVMGRQIPCRDPQKATGIIPAAPAPEPKSTKPRACNRVECQMIGVHTDACNREARPEPTKTDYPSVEVWCVKHACPPSECEQRHPAPTPRFVDRDRSGDWPEDSPYENGRYQNKCVNCGGLFEGHKRRLSCKLCAGVAPSAFGYIQPKSALNTARPSAPSAELMEAVRAVWLFAEKCSVMLPVFSETEKATEKFFALDRLMGVPL